MYDIGYFPPRTPIMKTVDTVKGRSMSVNADNLIGTFVRARRRDRKLTQARLAALAGVTRALVIDIERGKPTLRIDGVERVLSVFGKRLGPVAMDRSIDSEPIDDR